MAKWPLKINILVYFLFVFTYSVYLAGIFYLPKSEVLAQTQINETDFERCYFSEDTPTHCWIAEISLGVFIIILLLIEILQCLALGPMRYFKEIENWLEMLVLSLASVLVIGRIDQDSLKWVSACGVTLAWLELLVMQGRYPFQSESISLMFYGIFRQMLKMFASFSTLVFAFAGGFYILNYDKKPGAGAGFERPGKAIVRALTMVLGEFEFNDMYNAHDGDIESRSFTMILLVLLALTGHLVFLNLIIALIISDVDNLRKSSEIQSVVNKAQHIVFIETLVTKFFRCCLGGFKSKLRVPDYVMICGHHMCKCKFHKLSSGITESLREIHEERELKRSLIGGFDHSANSTLDRTMKNLQRSIAFSNRAAKSGVRRRMI